MVLCKRPRIALAAAALTFALPMAGASAANLFEMLFGGARQSVQSIPTPLPQVRPSGNPSAGVVEASREGGPSGSYCVRLCDGHPFPVPSGNSSTAQTCASMCPAAQTKVFTGSSMEHAVSTDGKKYSSLPNAFAYRKQLVADCTCNGKTAGGLARLDPKSDPTLRPGDIVATNEGLMSYRGGSGKSAEFSRVQDRKLASIPIRPASASALAANARAEEPAPKERRRRERDRDQR